MASFNNTNQVKSRPKSDQAIEELDSIGTVEEMYQKYIFPIDKYRSISSNQNFSNNTNSGNESYNVVTDASNFMESRVSAFYRMLGLPVATKKGFYNPGHDPNQRFTQESRSFVDKSFENEQFSTLLIKRENDLKAREKVFRAKNEESSIYASLLPIRSNFLFANKDLSPFKVDQQQQTINPRNNYLKTLNLSFSTESFFVAPSHILKPFVCHPGIVRTVQPERKTICVPFLPNKQSTSIGENYLYRPIIEYILRQRLEVLDSNSEQEKFKLILQSVNVDNLESIINNEDSIFNLKTQITNNNINSKALSTILVYSKAIKKCVLELSESVYQFQKLKAETKLSPLPSERGPEFGGTILIKNSAEEVSAKARAVEILKLRELLKTFSVGSSDSEITDNSVFASAEVFDLSADISNKIDNSTKKLSEKGDELNYHLKIIEIVTGEVSGIGLVDVLALYTTMWAIDLQYLVGLLDNNSLIRLSTVNNGNYGEVGAVALQLQGTRPSIEVCLEEFEKVFFNILTFADNVYAEIRKNPINQNRSKQGSV